MTVDERRKTCDKNARLNGTRNVRRELTTRLRKNCARIGDALEAKEHLAIVKALSEVASFGYSLREVHWRLVLGDV